MARMSDGVKCRLAQSWRLISKRITADHSHGSERFAPYSFLQCYVSIEATDTLQAKASGFTVLLKLRRRRARSYSPHCI